MMTEPICPKCGDTIEQFDIIEEFYDDEVFSLRLVGECPTCSRQYRWQETYHYYGVSFLEEVT